MTKNKYKDYFISINKEAKFKIKYHKKTLKSYNGTIVFTINTIIIIKKSLTLYLIDKIRNVREEKR